MKESESTLNSALTTPFKNGGKPKFAPFFGTIPQILPNLWGFWPITAPNYAETTQDLGSLEKISKTFTS